MPFPKIDACIVCEGIRQEIHSKSIILGYYGITPYVRVRIKDFSQPVTLCFVFTGGAGAGSYHLKLELIHSSGFVPENKFASVISGQLMPEIPVTNAMFAFQGVMKPGRYNLALIVDGIAHFKSSVELKQLDSSF